MKQKACRLSHLEDSIIEEKKIDKLVKVQRKRERTQVQMRVNHNSWVMVEKNLSDEEREKIKRKYSLPTMR